MVVVLRMPKTNQKLTSLNLHGMLVYFFDLHFVLEYYFLCAANKLGNEGARCIADVLKTNQTLTTLALDGIFFI